MADTETPTSHPSPLKKVKRAIKNYRLRRRRANTARRKSSGRGLTLLLAAVLLGLFGAMWWSYSFTAPQSTGDEIDVSQMLTLAKENRIQSATFDDWDDRIEGVYVTKSVIPEPEPKEDPKKDPKGENAKGDGAKGEGADDTKADGGKGDGSKKDDAKKGEEKEKPVPSIAPKGTGTFWMRYPASDALIGPFVDTLNAAGARVIVDQQTDKSVVRALSQYLLPLLILAVAFGLLFTAGKGGGGGIGEVMTFGTIGKARRKKGQIAPVTFNDVAGANEAVAELKEVVDYLTDPDRYDEAGAIPPKGVLLFGPPGCGKTLLAKAVAGEADVPFFSVAGAEFVESLVGVGAARVRDLFARVRAVSPAIVFIDELDAAGRRRGHGGGSGGSDEREQTLNQLLVEMDGFEVSTGIVVIGATNRPDILDPALLRPGRFDRHITVDQPDAEGRRLILELHARGRTMGSDVDFELLARRTPGFSGADLANVINEAALLALREKKKDVEMDELLEAVQRVLHGPKRKGKVLEPEERERAAYHESGHAVIAAALGRADDVHRVSILARGRGLGLTGIQRDTDQTLFTRKQIYSQLVTAMGGVAAEELIFSEPSTGAENDLELATEIARDMVGKYGFSPALGRARLVASETDQFLNNDLGLSELSAATHEAMDREVERVLAAAEHDARLVLEANRAWLDKMAERLVAQETLEGIELVRLMHDIPSLLERLNSPFQAPSANGSVRKQAERPAPTGG